MLAAMTVHADVVSKATKHTCASTSKYWQYSHKEGEAYTLPLCIIMGGSRTCAQS